MRRSGRLALVLAAAALATAVVAPSASESEIEPTALDRDRVVVPAGWFEMGDDRGAADERPARRVWLSAYAIDRHEVTNGQYHRFVEATGRTPPAYWMGGIYPAGTALLPVVGVSWPDACAFCSWVGGRLPTEAEWEKACRSTGALMYPWGDVWSSRLANTRSLSLTDADEAWGIVAGAPLLTGAPGLRAIGSFPAGASRDGVLDLVGNAAEWVADVYTWEGYASWPTVDPVGTGPAWNHSIRGSAWFGPVGVDPSVTSRCAERNSSHSFDDPRVGFRCAASLPARARSVTARVARGASRRSSG